MLRVGFVLRSTEIQPVCFRFVSPITVGPRGTLELRPSSAFPLLRGAGDGGDLPGSARKVGGPNALVASLDCEGHSETRDLRTGLVR